MVENIPVSGKHIKLRIIIFFVAFLVSITAFSYGIISCSRKNDGYYELERINEPEPIYSDIRCIYFVKSENNKQLFKDLSTRFTSFIKKASSYLEVTRESTSSNGLWVINNHLGEDIILDDDLYEIMKDAYNKTLNSKNYSIFAGPLYDEWDHLISVAKTDDYSLDPELNIEEAQYIDSLTSYVKNLSNFSVVFDDSRKTINVNISEEYKNFRTQNSITYPVISLNILEKAYAISLLGKWFKALNYTQCHFESNEGILLNLNEYNKIDFSFLGNDRNSIADLTLNGASSACVQYKYQTVEDDDCYSFTSSNKTIVRSRNINIKTGYPEKEIQSCLCCCKNVIESAFICNELIAYEDVENLPKNYEDFFFLLQDEQQNNYCFKSFDKVIVNSDKQINILGGN